MLNTKHINNNQTTQRKISKTNQQINVLAIETLGQSWNNNNNKKYHFPPFEDYGVSGFFTCSRCYILILKHVFIINSKGWY